jgi:hypothetical protein
MSSFVAIKLDTFWVSQTPFGPPRTHHITWVNDLIRTISFTSASIPPYDVAD